MVDERPDESYAGHIEDELTETVDQDNADNAGEQPVEDEQDVDALIQKVSTLQDQALRARAEVENAHRRAAKDVEKAHKFALDKFAAGLLPVMDSLEKAVETARAEAADEAAKLIADGVELSLKMFGDVLENFGVRQIDPMGEPFDPQEHEAIAMLESPSAEPNSVLEVMQKGYSLNGRLMRAAKVVVSKAPVSDLTPGRG